MKLALAAALVPAAGHADTFNFSATGTGYSASGVLTASNNGMGGYSITGITGTGITGLVAPNSDLFGDNDNLLLPFGARLLDAQGFAFNQIIGGTSYMVNLFSTASGYEVFAMDAASDGIDTAVTFRAVNTAAPTPEPSSWLLLASGMSGVAVTIRKRLSF